MGRTSLSLAIVAGLGLGCGNPSATKLATDAQARTRVIEEGGVSPFQASLSFKSPEAMAIQEVPYQAGPEALRRFETALAKYRNQWTLQLTVGPKPNAHHDPLRPLALDIENNGGMWGDRGRNLQRLMFEMGGFIRLRTRGGQEVEPSVVEFQRAFGTGLDRHFLLVFPRMHQGKALDLPFEIAVKEFGQGTGTLRFEMNQGPAALAGWQARRAWKNDADTNG